VVIGVYEASVGTRPTRQRELTSNTWTARRALADGKASVCEILCYLTDHDVSQEGWVSLRYHHHANTAKYSSEREYTKREWSGR
jgi:hypothetical protein